MIWTGVVMGVVGTLAMDIWAWVLSLMGQPKPNWAMPGRWLGHLARGRVFHEDIGAADVLARYQSWRRFDTMMMAAATEVVPLSIVTVSPTTTAARSTSPVLVTTNVHVTALPNDRVSWAGIVSA